MSIVDTGLCISVFIFKYCSVLSNQCQSDTRQVNVCTLPENFVRREPALSMRYGAVVACLQATLTIESRSGRINSSRIDMIFSDKRTSGSTKRSQIHSLLGKQSSSSFSHTSWTCSATVSCNKMCKYLGNDYSSRVLYC